MLGATRVERSSAAACRRAAPDCFAADSHGTGPTHVFLHGATSARPPSPRIGRILPSSLGELTGGAGLTSRAGALDSFIVSSGREENDGCGVDGAVRVRVLTKTEYVVIIDEILKYKTRTDLLKHNPLPV